MYTVIIIIIIIYYIEFISRSYTLTIQSALQHVKIGLKLVSST